MIQFFKQIKIETNGQQLIDITSKVLDIIESTTIKEGILNLSILHTSASLVVQENADEDVKKDLLNFFDSTVPMDSSLYIHNIEGKDDMPAHIKTALTNTNTKYKIKKINFRNLARYLLI